jgi:cytochrome c-type biogenesis protein
MGEYVGAFLFGIGATVTPCILPLYPAFLAYLTGSTQLATADGVSAPRATFPPALAAALVWLGVIVGMVAIGAAFAVIRAPLGDFNRIVLPLANLLLITLGGLLLLGINPFSRLPQISPRAVGGAGPALGAFGYGLLFAPIAVPCSGPFLVIIFAVALSLTDAASLLAFFLAFGVGFGLPLFVIGIVGQWRGAQLARTMVRFERPLQLVLGAVLVAVGLWDLTNNLPALLG